MYSYHRIEKNVMIWYTNRGNKIRTIGGRKLEKGIICSLIIFIDSV